mmetsp:Transcript_87715/g.272818  ORF Transcript_87715/g.272818 Transcript_87715/m.272818 type:complete len:236 (-) Transcript_87715:180-887(-)
MHAMLLANGLAYPALDQVADLHLDFLRLALDLFHETLTELCERVDVNGGALCVREASVAPRALAAPAAAVPAMLVAPGLAWALVLTNGMLRNLLRDILCERAVVLAAHRALAASVVLMHAIVLAHRLAHHILLVHALALLPRLLLGLRSMPSQLATAARRRAALAPGSSLCLGRAAPLFLGLVLGHTGHRVEGSKCLDGLRQDWHGPAQAVRQLLLHAQARLDHRETGAQVVLCH